MDSDPSSARLYDPFQSGGPAAVTSLREEFKKLAKQRSEPITHPEAEGKPANVSGGSFLIQHTSDNSYLVCVHV